ncbi:hypothetical protein DL769_003882 [Monosporascus sp. CRB-8-3]|nr:hypothetical protein DL769_003882 [Monosporascus sp. CRB-8-3]
MFVPSLLSSGALAAPSSATLATSMPSTPAFSAPHIVPDIELKHPDPTKASNAILTLSDMDLYHRSRRTKKDSSPISITSTTSTRSNGESSASSTKWNKSIARGGKAFKDKTRAEYSTSGSDEGSQAVTEIFEYRRSNDGSESYKENTLPVSSDTSTKGSRTLRTHF